MKSLWRFLTRSWILLLTVALVATACSSDADSAESSVVLVDPGLDDSETDAFAGEGLATPGVDRFGPTEFSPKLEPGPIVVGGAQDVGGEDGDAAEGDEGNESDDGDGGLGGDQFGTEPADVDQSGITPDFTTPASNSERYVDAINGDDNASGATAGEAWRTLGKGIASLEVGMTLWVMDGTYDEHLGGIQGHYVVNGFQGSPDQWTRILALPGHRPRIEVTKATGLEFINSSYVEFGGFEIEGVGFTDTTPTDTDQRRKPRGVLGVNGHHFYFHDLEVHGLPHSGIAGGENTSHFRIEDNRVYNNALWSDEGGSGISLWRLNNVAGGDDANGYSNYIVGNTLYENENREKCGCVGFRAITDGNGIIMDDSLLNGYQGRTLIASNVVFNNGGRAINVHKSSRVDVFNNTTYENSFTTALDGPRAEIAAYNSSDVRIQNNLLWPTDGVPHVYSNSDLDVSSNLFVADENGADGGNTLVRDPGIVSPSTDPSSADFRPLNGSPALGAGADGSVVGAYQD